MTDPSGLTWAIDKWLWVISTIMLLKTVRVATKELKETKE